MAEARGPRWRRLRRALLGAVGLGLLVVGAGNAWVIHASSADIAASVADAPARPVAIVLGNRVFPDGTLSRDLFPRVAVALALYRAGKVQRLFLSGAAVESEGYDEPEAMAGWLERRGVPRSAMILDRLGHRTAATMANAAAQGFKDVLVCTQWYHLPRSLYLARHVGLTATGVAADDGGRRAVDRARTFVRESVARVETIVEVAVRGVSAQ
jgi:SanA protein